MKCCISFENCHLETLLAKQNAAGEADDAASDDTDIEVGSELRGRTHVSTTFI